MRTSSQKGFVAGRPRVQSAKSADRNPNVQRLFLILARDDEPIVRIEVAAEPAVVQTPAPAIPVEVPHAAVAARAPPDFRKHQVVVPPFHRNLFLIPKHCLGMAQASKSSLLFGSFDHLLAAEAVLLSPQKLLQARLELALLGVNRLNARPALHVALDLGDELENQGDGHHGIVQEKAGKPPAELLWRQGNDIFLQGVSVELVPIHLGCDSSRHFQSLATRYGFTHNTPSLLMRRLLFLRNTRKNSIGIGYIFQHTKCTKRCNLSQIFFL